MLRRMRYELVAHRTSTGNPGRPKPSLANLRRGLLDYMSFCRAAFRWLSLLPSRVLPAGSIRRDLAIAISSGLAGKLVELFLQ